MDRQLFLASKKIMLTVVLLLAISYVQAQETKEPLTLTLDKALEIALSDNPTIKVAEEEIALKKVANKETWQSLLPEASIGGTWNHTITAAQMNLGGQSFKMGQDDSNTVSGTLNISLPLFAPSVYKAMSMTKTDIELAVEKSRASKQDLVNQVTKAYYQLMLAQDSYEVLQKSYKLAEDNYNVVNAKYQQGAVSEFDKISAEVQMRSVNELAAIGKGVDGQLAMVAAAAALDADHLLCKFFQFLLVHHGRGGLVVFMALAQAVQGSAVSAHQSGNVRPDDLHAHLFFKGAEHGFIIEGTALHHDLAAQLFRAGSADHLVQRVLDHADGQACGDILDAGTVLLRLLDRAVHEHSAAAAQVHRAVCEQTQRGKLLDVVAQRLRKGLQKAAAAGGAGLVQEDVADGAVLDLAIRNLNQVG